MDARGAPCALTEYAETLVFLGVICLLLWLIARSRRAVGPAIVALLMALLGLTLHAVLLVRMWVVGGVLAGPLVLGVVFVLLVLAALALLVAAAIEGPRTRRPRRRDLSSTTLGTRSDPITEPGDVFRLAV